MSWKKVNLFEYLRRWVFMDEYGFCRSELNGVFINDINISELYAYNDESKIYERIRFGNKGNYAQSLADLFVLDIAKSEGTGRRYYNYGYRNEYLTSDQAVSVKPKTIKVNLKTYYYVTFGYNGCSSGEYADDIIELNSKKDVNKYSCWFEEGSSTSSFKMIILPELKVDDELYLVGVGKVKVSNLVEYPNKDDVVCEAIDVEGKKQKIKMESEVFYLPYNKAVDEYEDVNKSLNELKLSPYVIRSKEQNHIYNIYWNKIEEASCYHVILYKYIELRNRRRVLKIADYEVDRNTSFLSLDKLVGANFIFKVKAEDRSGNIIAESRGAIDGSPRDFKK